MSNVNKFTTLQEDVEDDNNKKQGSRFENKFDNYEHAWTRQDIMNSRRDDNEHK